MKGDALLDKNTLDPYEIRIYFRRVYRGTPCSVYYAMCIIYFISSQNQDESDHYNNNAQHDSKSSHFV